MLLLFIAFPTLCSSWLHCLILYFLKKFSILKLILPAMNKQGQPHQAPFGTESLDSGKQFYWQSWDWASVSPGSIICIWGNRLNISHEIRICLQCRRPGFNSWVGKIAWRRKWQPTPVFLPWESHRQRSLAGYSPRGWKSWTQLSD